MEILSKMEFKSMDVYVGDPMTRITVTNGYLELMSNKDCYVVVQRTFDNFKELCHTGCGFMSQDGGYAFVVNWEAIQDI